MKAVPLTTLRETRYVFYVMGIMLYTAVMYYALRVLRNHEKPKITAAADTFRPPPPKKISLSPPPPLTQNGMLPQHYAYKNLSYICLNNLNFRIMVIKGSIYANNIGGGLKVEGGMLINNRPDDRTWIAKAVELKKAAKVAQKVAIYSEAMRSTMMECDHVDMYSGPSVRY